MPGAEIFDAVVPPAPPGYFGGRRRGVLRRLSDRTPLRTKLITAVLALVIMALAAISLAGIGVLRSYLTTQYDSQLQNSLSSLVAAYEGGQLSGSAGYANPVGPETTVGIQVPGKQLTWYSPSQQGQQYQGYKHPLEQPLPSLPTATGWAGSSASGEFVTVSALSGSSTWRVLATTITYPVSDTSSTTQPSTLLVAADLGNIGATLNRFLLFDLAISGVLVLVLLGVGAYVVQSNLRPLNDIEMTAGQIAAGHLNHRVPERDPRTEIGSLGRSLNAMLTQIETAFLAREESERAAHESEERMRRFIADASHELRTPLTTIRGFAAHYRQRGGANGSRVPVSSGSVSRTGAADSPADSYLVDPGALTPEELDHLMGRMESEATRMGLLVEDLLTLARLDQQRPLNIGPVDLLTLAADAVQDARIVSPDRPISLSVAPGTAFLVDGDEPRLRQVISNLVNNALTHTPAGTPVRVTIARGALEGGAGGVGGSGGAGRPAVTLDVADEGPGMSEDQARRVFERFYRADAARNRASGGTGLGLAIVAGLVAAHGGTVAVYTAPGRGADFQVKLPLSPDALMVNDDGDDELAG